jgi:type I restriction enzyme S subunit
MSFPRYPKYKASGVEWLGDVPVGWEAKPLKYSTLVYTGNSLNETEKKLYESTDPEALPYISSKDIDFETHEVQYENGLRIPNGQCGLKVAPSGSFLLCVEGGSAGRKVALLRHDVCFVNKLCCFSSRQNNKFRFYFSQSQNFKDKFGLSLTGLIGGVSTSLLKNFQIPTPSDPEQTAIAEFLDRETGKIDDLVAEQRRLMELLKEKRQAVISHTVTKGLNPNAKMKPSGIEWLGDVPEHWEVGKVKHYFSTCSGGTPNTAQQSLYYTMEGDGFPWVRTTDLNNDFVTTVPVYITEQAIKDTACAVLPQGTVMVAMYGGDGTVGKNGLLMFPATINQAVCGLLPSETHDNEYVFRFIQFYRPYWMIGAESSRTDPNISQDRVKNAPFPKPPIDEQHDIVQFLNEKLATFDGLIAEAQRAIDLLQERRTALISAAVTGQIDVRNQTSKGKP